MHTRVGPRARLSPPSCDLKTRLFPPARAGLLGSHFAQDIRLVAGVLTQVLLATEKRSSSVSHLPSPTALYGTDGPIFINQSLGLFPLEASEGPCHWEQQWRRVCINATTFRLSPTSLSLLCACTGARGGVHGQSGVKVRG